MEPFKTDPPARTFLAPPWGGGGGDEPRPHGQGVGDGWFCRSRSTVEVLFNADRTAATITLYPLVPDYEHYEFGRDLDYTTGEIGLAGHWLKHLLHHMFIYKAKCLPGWSLIPE